MTPTFQCPECGGREYEKVTGPVKSFVRCLDVKTNGEGVVVGDCNWSGPASACGLDEPEKHRASWLTVPQQFLLNAACRPLKDFGYGTYHVGSSLERDDYHDVDVRCILADDEFDGMFSREGGVNRLAFLNAAVSKWISDCTGLPIDFQFQRATEANEQFKGRRNALGH